MLKRRSAKAKARQTGLRVSLMIGLLLFAVLAAGVTFPRAASATLQAPATATGQPDISSDERDASHLSSPKENMS